MRNGVMQHQDVIRAVANLEKSQVQLMCALIMGGI